MPCSKDSNFCWKVFLHLAVLEGTLFSLEQFILLLPLSTQCFYSCAVFLFFFYPITGVGGHPVPGQDDILRQTYLGLKWGVVSILLPEPASQSAQTAQGNLPV